jgi:hypothetical protein
MSCKYCLGPNRASDQTNMETLPLVSRMHASISCCLHAFCLPGAGCKHASRVKSLNLSTPAARCHQVQPAKDMAGLPDATANCDTAEVGTRHTHDSGASTTCSFTSWMILKAALAAARLHTHVCMHICAVGATGGNRGHRTVRFAGHTHRLRQWTTRGVDTVYEPCLSWCACLRRPDSSAKAASIVPCIG